MALKVNATLVLTRAEADRLIISTDPQQAAHEIASYLRRNLPSVATENLVVTVQESKKDGTPKKNAQTYSTDDYTGEFSN